MSFAASLATAMLQRTTTEFPFVRRDKTVRARVLAEFNDDNCSPKEMVLIETMQPARKFLEPCKRIVTKEYFDNNYWEGAD